MNRILFTIISALVLLLSGQAMAGNSLHDTIQSREDQWSAAYNANNKDDLGGFYEADAVLIPPGSAPVNGRKAIAEALSALFPLLKDMKLVADEVRPLGPDYALEIGHSEFNTVAEDGSRSPGIDNYQVIWHRDQDGVWRYVTDMFNPR